ncbi:MAG: hypothetical protein Q4G02_00550 [bacterium]|nr:hypothetical protein [bacterium]
MQIVPAILESNLDQVAEKLEIIKTDGHFGVVQIDITDGQLVPQLTVTPLDLVDLDYGQLKLDFHLMTEEPLDYVWELAAQEPILPVRAVFGQVERMGEQKAFLQAVRERGWKSGLALDLETPIDSINENAWTELDEVLLLAVPMGAQGQIFDSEVLIKAKELQEEIRARNLEIKISIDGGVKPEQLKELKDLNIDQAVIGSFLWSGDFDLKADELDTEE